MGYAESKMIAVEEIPVIDFSGFLKGKEKDSYVVAHQIREAAEGVGFFIFGTTASRNMSSTGLIRQQNHFSASLRASNRT